MLQLVDGSIDRAALECLFRSVRQETNDRLREYVAELPCQVLIRKRLTNMRRRGHGEGSIHKRKDGRYVAVVNLGYESGKRRRKYLYGKTRREVQGKLSKALRNLQLGLPAPSDRLTVAGFLDSWLENSVRNILKPRTVESYEMVVRLHLRPALGRVALTKLTPELVQKYLNQKLETGLSPRTVAYHRTVLRSALGKAEKWGQVARNVAKLADPPRVPKNEVEPLSQVEVQQLLEAARGDWLEALYVCAVAIGMRQGELLGLRWQGRGPGRPHSHRGESATKAGRPVSIGGAQGHPPSPQDQSPSNCCECPRTTSCTPISRATAGRSWNGSTIGVSYSLPGEEPQLTRRISFEHGTSSSNEPGCLAVGSTIFATRQLPFCSPNMLTRG